MRSPAYRRYGRRVAITAIAYLGATLLAARLVPEASLPTTVPILLALLPGAAIVAFLAALLRLYVELEDEYLRMLEIRKAIVATGLTLAVTSVWGMLELFTQVPRLAVFYVFPIWCFGLVVGSLVNRAGHGVGGCG